MNQRKMIIGLLLVIVSLSPAAQNTSVHPKSTPEREARMAWWREARFGMFVHWGLYAGLAGTWKEKQVSQRGGMEWIQQRVKADTWEYAHEATPHFNPMKGFAKQWAQLAREAGCRYVVFTSKHHDGFALHDSATNTYDAKDVVGRDLCREIVDAVRGEGLKVGMYHSVIDWHHPQYDYVAAGKLPHPLKGKPFANGSRDHRLYVDYLHRQVEELMTHYGPIDIIWWDYSKENAEGPFWRSDELMAMVRQHQPKIVSNNRLYRTLSLKGPALERLKIWDPERGDFTTPEQHIPATGLPGVDWEVCMTMNTTWGYSEHDHAWKSDEVLIQNLVDIVSKGGNYLLNIGPKGDGSIPDASIKSMEAIGRWMKVNGESIYGTTASPFDKPSWGRYTQKAGKLYVHIFEWPENGKLEIPVPSPKATRAYLLADRTSELTMKTTGGGLVVQLPAQPPDAIVSVVAIEMVD